MKSLIIGASAGLGRALADQLAARGDGLFLVASAAEDLDPLARDLRIRHGAEIHWQAFDLRHGDIEALRQQVLERMGSFDNLFLVAGLGDGADCGAIDDDLAIRLMAINFTAPVRVANAFLPDLQATPAGNCVGIGSVAAIRGRSNNMVYGAAKRGLEAYFEAIRHRLATSGCRVQFYRVGFMATTMLGARPKFLPVARPEDVAARIVANLGRDLGTAYLPGWWSVLGLILRHAPWVLFRRLRA